jgi:hypothetical protein
MPPSIKESNKKKKCIRYFLCTYSSTVFRDESKNVQKNPYLQFLKKPEHLAATWRPKDEFVVPSGMPLSAAAPLLLDPKKTLNDKAKAVTNAVSHY